MKEKELEEARARLKRLRNGSKQAVEAKPGVRDPRDELTDHYRKRKRVGHDGSSTPNERGKGREYSEDEGPERSGRHRRRKYTDSDEGYGRSSGRRKDHHLGRRNRSRSRLDEIDAPSRSRKARSQRTRSRSLSPNRDRDHRKLRRRKHRSRSRSPRHTDAPSSKTRLPQNDTIPPPNGRRRDYSSDSDPLEAIVGPSLPLPEAKVRPRGRGATAASSAMDTHFSSTYNPSVDIYPNSDSENDWEEALEALRDRQRWKQTGADRLRAAGFTDVEVSKWEKGEEKTEADVSWKGRGEGREWDRGKVVDEDGMVNSIPEWGRLKGT